MKKSRWRYIILASWLIFTAAFLLHTVLLRLSSVAAPELRFWALTHTPSQWAVALVLATLTYATFIFGPLQLPFMAWWSARKVEVPLKKRLSAVLLPCVAISLWWGADTWQHPPSSKQHFTSLLGRPVPPSASRFMAMHPLGAGPFAEFWGSVHGFRMQLPPAEASALCRDLGGARYDFAVDSLAEPYDSFLSSLPRDWGYTLGQPHLEFHQLPPVCGKPAFAVVDPVRHDLLVMVWQQGAPHGPLSGGLFPTTESVGGLPYFTTRDM